MAEPKKGNHEEAIMMEAWGHHQERGAKARWGQGNRGPNFFLFPPTVLLLVPPIS